MKKPITLALAFITCISPIFSQSCADIWTNYVQSTDPNSKLVLLNTYIEYGCRDSLAQAYLLRGKISLSINNPVSAKQDFLKAVEVNPVMADGWYQLASATYLIQDYNPYGIIYLTKAINLDPQNWRYYMLRGDVYTAAKDINDCLADYQKALELFQTFSKTKNTDDLKMIYQAVGGALTDWSQKPENQSNQTDLLNDAIYHLQQAVRVDSTFDNAYFLLGNAYFYAKKYDEGIEAYQHSLRLNPDNKSVTDNLTLIYRVAGKYQGEIMNNLPKALEYLEKSYALNPNDPETVRLLGVANGIGGNQEKAIVYFKKGTEIAPENADMWWNLGNAYEILGNKKDSKKCREKALRLNPYLDPNKH